MTGGYPRVAGDLCTELSPCAARSMRCVGNPPGPCRDFDSPFWGFFAPA